MIHDKEELYDEAIKLKQSMNHYKDENSKLKTRVAQFEGEVERKDKAIQDLLTQAASQPGANVMTRAGSETHLVVALKKQLRDMREELKAKDEETKKLKKNLKITRLQETEVEIKMFSDECTRLKHIIEEIVKQKSAGYSPQEVAMIEGRINQQEAMLSNIKQENGEMAGIIQKKQDEIRNWKEVSSKLGKRHNKLEAESKENVKNRKTLTEGKKELQKLKDQLSALKGNGKDKEAAAFRARIDELLRKQSELGERLEQKEKRVKTLEAKLAESPAKEGEREGEIQALRKQAKERTASSVIPAIGEAETAELRKKAQEEKVVRTGVAKSVSKEEVQFASAELRLTLMLLHVPADSLASRVPLYVLAG